jgi:hypothetical protein
MLTIARFAKLLIVLLSLLLPTNMPACAGLYTLAASGTVTTNSSGDPIIPVGTPWSFELTYNTSAPDLDFELVGAPDPTFGRFNNTAAPPAMMSFKYKAGSYEAILDDPTDFGPSSVIDVTFTSINAMDINIFAPALFPQISGRPVSFHADFNRFVSPPVFSSDGLPTNTTINVGDFNANTVSLLPQSPPTSEVTSSNVTSLTVSLSGDFNSDGIVNAADYVLWRNNFSSDQVKYAAWRTNFGASLGSGSGSSRFSAGPTSVNVPEPAMLTLVLFVAAGSTLQRRRPASSQQLASGLQAQQKAQRRAHFAECQHPNHYLCLLRPV